MISFRYHVASLTAVLLALAVGVVLGTGPLDDPGGTSAVAAERAGDEADAARQEAARLEAALSFDDEFATGAAPAVVAGALRGHAVTLVRLPGAPADQVAALSALVGRAGGSVASDVEARAGLLDPSNRQLVEELGTQLAAAARGAKATSQADGYARVASLLGYAVGTRQAGGSAVPPRADGVLAGLTTADLVGVPDPVTRRGDLVLVVAAAPGGDDDARRGAAAVVAALCAGLDRRTRGVVVAGPASAASDHGVVAELRADARTDGTDGPGASDGVSTVDSVDRPAGRVAAVLALAAQARGTAGAYGAVGDVDGALPPRK